tara:strand:- start:462 stop:836 length:375 start_codon:yes stop_codon:yes gene_type:complete
MSVKIVRIKSGEDIICDLHEVITKDEQQSVVGFQFSKPYSVFLESGNQREFLIEGDSPIQEEAEPILMMEPWVPLAAKQHVIVRADEVVTAYDPLPEVINKYNELVEATDGRVTGEIDPVEDQA